MIVTRFSLIFQFFLLLGIIPSGMSLNAQVEVWAKTKNGKDSINFWLHEYHGTQSSSNVVTGQLNNHGPQEDMGIVIAYARYESRYQIAAQSMTYIGTADKSRFGFVAIEGMYNILPFKRHSHMSVQGQRTSRNSPLVEAFRIRFPIVSAGAIGLNVRVARENHIGSRIQWRIQNNSHDVTRLTTTEIAAGPCVVFFRHMKMSWERSSELVKQRGLFFSARMDAVWYPIVDYSVSRNTYYGSYAPPFVEDSLLQNKLTWRLQFDGRLKYLTRGNLGFSWKAGFMKSAFWDGIYYFGGIGMYYGWGKRKELELE